MRNRSSDHGQPWIIPKSCLFVFEMWPDSTWASRHAPAMQAPSGTTSQPGSSCSSGRGLESDKHHSSSEAHGLGDAKRCFLPPCGRLQLPPSGNTCPRHWYICPTLGQGALTLGSKAAVPPDPASGCKLGSSHPLPDSSCAPGMRVDSTPPSHGTCIRAELPAGTISMPSALHVP